MRQEKYFLGTIFHQLMREKLSLNGPKKEMSIFIFMDKLAEMSKFSHLKKIRMKIKF
jgi:hypothetical protein